MSFNSLNSLNVDSFRGLYTLDELRLDGNSLTSFPWESLTDMPNLRLLDLHNNKLSSIPTEATRYIKNITYLDLSSNSLTTAPAEVLTMWLSVKPSQDMDTSKLILGRDQVMTYEDTGKYSFFKPPCVDSGGVLCNVDVDEIPSVFKKESRISLIIVIAPNV